MIKKTYDKPQVKVVELKPVTLICTSPLTSVNVNRNSVMDDDEETMSVEELRAMLHETIRKEYALP